ncbi:MAG: hypothetical protein E6I26_09590 [Chloroflexi bacterium]|nr:MAG: hypothetical protein E6I26_09590 [Chloroflexota bacterium]
MAGRPPTMIGAISLLILIGVSGIGAGGGLLSVTGFGDAAADVRGAALMMGAGIAGYGIACAFAAAGIWSRTRWGWLLGVVTVGIGLVLLIVATIIAGPDSILGLGLVVWGLTLACLLAPGTRRAGVSAPETP